MGDFKLDTFNYNHQASWIAPIIAEFPFAQEITKQKQDIFLRFIGPHQRVIRIAVELKKSDVESTVMGFGKGGKLANEFQESYILKSLGFDEVWLLIALEDKPYKPVRYCRALEACFSIAFRKAFVKVYESAEAAMTNLKKLIEEYSPDACPTAYVNDSNLPTSLHRMIAALEGIGEIGQAAVDAFYNSLPSHPEFKPDLDQAMEWICTWARNTYPNDNRTRLLVDYVGGLVEPWDNRIKQEKPVAAVKYPYYCCMEEQVKTSEECGKCPELDAEGHCDAQVADLEHGFVKGEI